MCSTPVGVMDRFTSQCFNLLRFFMCSTPVGVMDRFTPQGLDDGPKRPCAQRLSASWIGSPKSSPWVSWCHSRAQRLSASWIGSPNIQVIGANGALCSTPVGVMDRFTTVQPVFLSIASSAQRLSASWIGSLEVGANGKASMF